jgi:23S rRNA (guanine745-N1)-methyltransferase
VIPGPDHLIELRSDLGLLDIEADKRQHVVEQFSGTFKLVGEQSIAYEMQLDSPELLDLIQMTPNYWHIERESLDSVKALERVRTRASFTLFKFYK